MREAYVRAVVKVGDIEVIAGLELRPDDNYRALRGAVRVLIFRVINNYHAMMNDPAMAGDVETMLAAKWPDRAYFIEVSSEPDEGWVQIFDPKGFVRRDG